MISMSDQALIESLVFLSFLCGICVGGIVWEIAHWLRNRKHRDA